MARERTSASSSAGSSPSGSPSSRHRATGRGTVPPQRLPVDALPFSLNTWPTATSRASWIDCRIEESHRALRGAGDHPSQTGGQQGLSVDLFMSVGPLRLRSRVRVPSFSLSPRLLSAEQDLSGALREEVEAPRRARYRRHGDEACRDPWCRFRGPGTGDATLRVPRGQGPRHASRAERLL